LRGHVRQWPPYAAQTGMVYSYANIQQFYLYFLAITQFLASLLLVLHPCFGVVHQLGELLWADMICLGLALQGPHLHIAGSTPSLALLERGDVLTHFKH
jgi:hypothetical protein